MQKNTIMNEDLQRIYDGFGERERLNGATILVTGCAGFLGYYTMQFFSAYAKKLGIRKVIASDNFLTGKPAWIDDMARSSGGVIQFHAFDIVKDSLEKLEGVADVSYVIHMASVASPVFYRQFPIETLDANVWGLRKLLDYYRDKKVDGFLMFSSSEVYGDPDPGFIPTPESYRGNVATVGPRACYDEAKRFSETMCYLFAAKHGMRITMARPFNNYGPGMKLNDQRVPADFAKAVVNDEDIVILSDGKPTRTFCYITDAITGYFKVLTYGSFDIFNIGIEKPEITIAELAQIYVDAGKKVSGYRGRVRLEAPKEADYMTDNPNRRCPIIGHAREKLGYSPSISVNEGVERFLRFLKEGGAA